MPIKIWRIRCKNLEVFIMAEMTVQFKNQINGYAKKEVKEFLKVTEEKLQEKALALANLQQQVVDLEARLNKLTDGDLAVEEKVELYDKLMKKMDGDYENLLRPAIARAKAIEEKAEAEYAARMDEARRASDAIFTETADQLADLVSVVVDENMDRVYGLLDEYFYSKTFIGRVETFIADCKTLSSMAVNGIDNAARATGRACRNTVQGYIDTKKKITDAIKASVQEKIDGYKAAIEAAKASR